MLEQLADVRNLIERGGDVLIVIGFVTAFMWTLILERLWYYWWIYPKLASDAEGEWRARTDHSSWHARQIRRLLLSQAQVQLGRGLSMINTLVAVCPLLGLLGTVTGMIEVFDVMAIAGSSNARAMAGGVSKATIPTMAGMVAALSGLLLSDLINRYANDRIEQLSDRLLFEEE